MSYPLSESFATAPAAGYTAVLGGMAFAASIGATVARIVVQPEMHR